MGLSILISETENHWKEEMISSLKSHSYEVDSSLNGKDCQLKLYKNKYLAVVLDLETKNHSGLEVLRYLRLNVPSVKVILSVRSKKVLNDLSFNLDDLRKLGACDILVKPYSIKMLLESIEGEKQSEAWRDVKVSDLQGEEETIDANDNQFTRIKIEDFYSGNATIFDCYLKLRENKYIKILHRGDFFDKDRIEKYSSENIVTHLYFKTSERAVYINFINNMLEKMLLSDKASPDKKVKTAKSLTEKFVEEIYTVGIKPQLIEEGQKICKNIFNLIEKSPDLSNLLEKLEEHDPPAYTHLFVVSFMSVVICKSLDWSSTRTVELIAFGSLLHDIGKLKLPEEFRFLCTKEMNAEQLKQYKQHPLLGVEMLQKYPIISEPIRQIVYQHHEYVNGEGFPNGLTGIKIYPLAKIVSLSDAFSKFLIENKVSPIEGLRGFVSNREEIVKYDANLVKALISGFIKERK